MESILNSIKKKLPVDIDCEDFDEDIIMDINTSFSHLTQLGVGPTRGFEIEDDEMMWSDYMPNNKVLLGFIKQFIYVDVKLAFDPPASSSHIDALKRRRDELEQRICIEAETPTRYVESDGTLDEEAIDELIDKKIQTVKTVPTDLDAGDYVFVEIK